MKHEIITLNKYFAALNAGSCNPVLHTYVQDNSPLLDPDKLRPAVVVCPGGAYRLTSDREAEPVALRFLAAGYQVFVLRYSCAPHRYPQALLELSAAVALVRSRAADWHVDVQKIAVGGFSAGGHLAASLANFWSEDFITRRLATAPGQNKPDALLLCYPVISSGPYAHRASFENLLGEAVDENENKKLSLETSVNEKNPPAFLWHTVTDAAVPVQNSLLYAQALLEKHIPLELHLYPQGVHGLSLADESTAAKDNRDHLQPHAAAWFAAALAWLDITL